MLRNASYTPVCWAVTYLALVTLPLLRYEGVGKPNFREEKDCVYSFDWYTDVVCDDKLLGVPGHATGSSGVATAG